MLQCNEFYCSAPVKPPAHQLAGFDCSTPEMHKRLCIKLLANAATLLEYWKYRDFAEKIQAMRQRVRLTTS